MLLKDIFQKPVERPIKGVIIADDAESLRIEMEEYVITHEVEKRLESFLSAYNNYQGANGGWISGFFGSGKSHLLKMLALVLENRTVDGVPAAEIFLPKCGDNAFLSAEFKRAVSIPSKSILFNIDQKAGVIHKQEVDALLSVFVKVFDEMQGYFGKQAHVAQFERDLDSRGLYQPFMDAYEKIAGKSWLRGREQNLIEKKNIAKAYATITDGDESVAAKILEEYRSQLSISIEDFAENVSAYIQKQEPSFRLNFFVDEVGQYIADNIKLMTNLQTIAESLATKCRGKAWIIVTAQEDMDSVIGEMNKKQANDFTKIQDRFANRIKLTSANVAEVIQKRLLTKNLQGIDLLSKIYEKEQANFKTFFTFADGGKEYKNFSDSDHFIHSYPFIPYQFSLFQASIKNLSLHNAFEGKHSSVGERSMLGVFQQVATYIGSNNVGQLATFDLMFEGIRSSLKSAIQRSILQAEEHLTDSFAIRILKALFLVKYIREFKSSVRHICVLMQESFEQDLKELRKNIEASLDLLERQSYITRHGDVFEYLTVDEKDIEEEIKNTEVPASELAAELEKLVFTDVIKDVKIRHENGQDFSFTRKLDDATYGREHELFIHIVSPFHPNSNDDETVILAQSIGRNELLVLLPPDKLLYSDLILYKQTEKYVNLEISTSQKENVKRILENKRDQSRERRTKLKERLEMLMSTARMFIAASAIEVGNGDGQTRVKNGFAQLIARTYTNLPMLRGKNYAEKDIETCLIQKQEELAPLSEAEQEVLNTIQSCAKSGVNASVKALLETFERRPYGWSFASILCILAKLCAREKVEVRKDSIIIAGKELAKLFRNTQVQPYLLLQAQVQFTAAQQRALKNFYSDFFEETPHKNEAIPLAEETKNAFREKIEQLESILRDKHKYPFVDCLAHTVERLKEVIKQPTQWFLLDLPKVQDTLFELKEKELDPITNFMHGAQRNIYDAAFEFAKKNESNFNYIRSNDVNTLKEVLSATMCPKGQSIQLLKVTYDNLQAQVASWLETEKNQAKAIVGGLRDELYYIKDFMDCTLEQRENIIQRFDQTIERIEKQNLIAVIRDLAQLFKYGEYVQIMQQIMQLSKPEDAKHINFISLNDIKIAYDKKWLNDAADVESYTKSLQKALLDEIAQGKKVQI